LDYENGIDKLNSRGLNKSKTKSNGSDWTSREKGSNPVHHPRLWGWTGLDLPGPMNGADCSEGSQVYATLKALLSFTENVLVLLETPTPSRGSTGTPWG
jgi:hypothetical protein